MNVNYDELILLTGGAFAAVWGYGKYVERKKLLATGLKAEGTVIELRSGGSRQGNTVYTPVIKFETLNKEWITKEYGFGSSTSKYRVGDSVDVIYEAGDPNHFIIDNRQNELLGPVLIGVGVILIVSVIVYFFINQYR